MLTIFLFIYSIVFASIEKLYIRHSRQCFIGFPNTSNFVVGFGYPDKTLSLITETCAGHMSAKMTNNFIEEKVNSPEIRTVALHPNSGHFEGVGIIVAL